MHALIRVAFVLSLALTASGQGIYHEAWCPSVDVARMPRLSRTAAVAKGLEPAADCHPEMRVRYLGEVWLPPVVTATSERESADAYSRAAPEPMIHIDGYYKDDGTYVKPHDRHWPRQR
ncbi:MAG TPA: hypothetical protein VF824_16925 [Thermoanaerobaculia bacterium]|jgi:hypothetical protein